MALGYLRYPHVHGDLVTFVAGDEVWLAPAEGGRAWRLSADGAPVSHPRFSRDGTLIAWTSWRDGQPEVYAADPEGGAAARLTYWGDPQTRVTGWTTEMARDGLVFDVRGNNGGHISQLVVEKLARRVIGWCLARWLRPETYPVDARRGPLVTVADEYAGSDGDIVTAAIRLLGLGPVVGARTWGGVIGIEGRQALVDGTAITVPRDAFSFEEYDWGVENYGVDPDVEVLNTPDDWAAGRDAQLETAVRLALEALGRQPPRVPPDVSTAPVKARPPLPA